MRLQILKRPYRPPVAKAGRRFSASTPRIFLLMRRRWQRCSGILRNTCLIINHFGRRWEFSALGRIAWPWRLKPSHMIPKEQRQREANKEYCVIDLSFMDSGYIRNENLKIWKSVGLKKDFWHMDNWFQCLVALGADQSEKRFTNESQHIKSLQCYRYGWTSSLITAKNWTLAALMYYQQRKERNANSYYLDERWKTVKYRPWLAVAVNSIVAWNRRNI